MKAAKLYVELTEKEIEKLANGEAMTVAVPKKATRVILRKQGSTGDQPRELSAAERFLQSDAAWI